VSFDWFLHLCARATQVRKCRGPASSRACWDEEAPETPAPCGIHHLSLTAYILLSDPHVTPASSPYSLDNDLE
jgi:hypothetical protein